MPHAWAPQAAELPIVHLPHRHAWPSAEPQKTKECWVWSASRIRIIDPHNIPFFYLQDPDLSDKYILFVLHVSVLKGLIKLTSSGIAVGQYADPLNEKYS